MIYKNRLLSQNFFKNPGLVTHLASKAGFGKNDLVLDIGAGTGIITKELATKCSRVIAVEIDSDLITVLRKNLSIFENVEIQNTDIRQYVLPITPFKVFANLPFHITAEVIYKLLYNPNPPVESYLVMQKEAAQKFAGIPRETQFSLLAKLNFEFKIMWEFNKSDFEPEPDIDTVLLKIIKRSESLVDKNQEALYQSFIKFAFGTWKKDLKVGLKKIFTYNQWRKLATDNNFNIHSKPTDLTFDQWLNVFKFYETIKV